MREKKEKIVQVVDCIRDNIHCRPIIQGCKLLVNRERFAGRLLTRSASIRSRGAYFLPKIP